MYSLLVLLLVSLYTGHGLGKATERKDTSRYRMFIGDGSSTAGWPDRDAWLSFESMWNRNVPLIKHGCAAWAVASNSAYEIAYLRGAILNASTSASLDPSFVLAIVLQESKGCVRVISTEGYHTNPGLMQSHDGAGSCNRGGVVQTPCPEKEIRQMIDDGVEGTQTGAGLSSIFRRLRYLPSKSNAQQYYQTARIYNGGQGGFVPADLGKGCCTLCYASDVANRLIGWSGGESGCSLGVNVDTTAKSTWR